MSNSCFTDFVNYCPLLLQIVRLDWLSGLVVKVVVKIAVIASPSASSVSIFDIFLYIK